MRRLRCAAFSGLPWRPARNATDFTPTKVDGANKPTSGAGRWLCWLHYRRIVGQMKAIGISGLVNE
jgi:hypothetical protein